MKKILLSVVLFATIILTGCAGMGPLGQNIVAGGILGAGVGAVAGDNRQAVARGAGAGAILGALLTGNQPQQYYGQTPYSNQPQPQGQPSCPQGGQLVNVNGQLRCQQNQYGQQPYGGQFVANNSQQGLVCGHAQFNMSCPSTQIGNCRRCQLPQNDQQQYGQTPYGQQPQGQPSCPQGGQLVQTPNGLMCRN